MASWPTGELDRLPQIGRDGSFKGARLMFARDYQAEPPGVQLLPGDRKGGPAPTVDPIADDRTTQKLEVDPKLMSSPSERP